MNEQGYGPIEMPSRDNIPRATRPGATRQEWILISQGIHYYEIMAPLPSILSAFCTKLALDSSQVPEQCSSVPKCLQLTKVLQGQLLVRPPGLRRLLVCPLDAACRIFFHGHCQRKDCPHVLHGGFVRGLLLNSVNHPWAQLHLGQRSFSGGHQGQREEFDSLLNGYSSYHDHQPVYLRHGGQIGRQLAVPSIGRRSWMKGFLGSGRLQVRELGRLLPHGAVYRVSTSAPSFGRRTMS